MAEFLSKRDIAVLKALDFGYVWLPQEDLQRMTQLGLVEGLDVTTLGHEVIRLAESNGYYGEKGEMRPPFPHAKSNNR